LALAILDLADESLRAIDAQGCVVGLSALQFEKRVQVSAVRVKMIGFLESKDRLPPGYKR